VGHRFAVCWPNGESSFWIAQSSAKTATGGERIDAESIRSRRPIPLEPHPRNHRSDNVSFCRWWNRTELRPEQGFRAGFLPLARSNSASSVGPSVLCIRIQGLWPGSNQSQPDPGDIWRPEQRHHSRISRARISSRCWAFRLRAWPIAACAGYHDLIAAICRSPSSPSPMLFPQHRREPQILAVARRAFAIPA